MIRDGGRLALGTPARKRDSAWRARRTHVTPQLLEPQPPLAWVEPLPHERPVRTVRFLPIVTGPVPIPRSLRGSLREPPVPVPHALPELPGLVLWTLPAHVIA